MSAQGVDPGLWWRLRYILDPPRARLWRSTNQSIATGVNTAVSFDTVRHSGGGAWLATAPTRLPAPVSGLYAITGVLRLDTVAGGARRAAFLRVNGGTFIATAEQGPPAAGGFPGLAVATEYELAAGDYVELYALHDAGVNVTVNAVADFSPVLTLRRVADKS